MRNEDIYTIHIRYPKRSMGLTINNITSALDDYLRSYTKRRKRYKLPSNREIVISKKVWVD